jgi:tRNA1Val (adenine37-N6)-methyltransferase
MSKFNFRDFSIYQTNSPLKVGTDAILLGASVDISEESTRVLDVGTGTGVIAMILASRFQHVLVTALEPNESAFMDASINFSNATFSDRLHIAKVTIQDFAQAALFDIVVTNPPYFIDDLKSTDLDKMQAKHIDELTFFIFLDACLLQLKASGLFWLVLPKPIAEMVCDYLHCKGLKLLRKTRFHSNINKPDVRWVLAFAKNENSALEKDHLFLEEELLIRNTDGSFHQDYINLAGYLHAKNL